MNKIGSSVLLLLGLTILNQASAMLKSKHIVNFEKQQVEKLRQSALGESTYQTKYFDVAIDHFTNNGTSPTYKMRYLVNDTFATVTNPPILFYCGNEGPIDAFYNNSGYMTEFLAQELNGLLLFAEHRYYGDSMPFGSESLTP